MRVGIIDVGSNTLRLLVAARDADGVAPVRQERAQVGLAAAIERHGWIPAEKVEEAASHAREFAAAARAANCAQLEVVVTAPGRQAVNADDLLVALQRATGAAPRVLSADAEGRLAYLGALAGSAPTGVTAVCDVGGGSTELVAGRDGRPPSWLASLDIGSLRLTSRCLESRSRRSVRRAAAVAEELFAGIEPPEPPDAGLAVGGSARALGKLAEGDLTAETLADAVDLLTGRSPEKVARTLGVSQRRAETLLGGAIILAQAQRALGVPLVVSRAGLREGLAGELLASARAA